MWLVDLNYIFECDWLIELSDNKVSNNKLSNNKLSDNNLASELVENRTFFKPIKSEEIVNLWLTILQLSAQWPGLWMAAELEETFVLTQTLLLLLCKSSCSPVN